MSGAAEVRRADVAHARPAHRGPVPTERPAPHTEQPAPSTGPIPVEEAPLDPRAIARASLDAARNVSLWWTCSGIVVATVVALAAGTRWGVFVLALVTLAGAIARAVLPSPGPVALTVRAKAIDVVVLALLSLGLVVLAQILPR